MIRKANPETDQISRSLLQKAIRRGNIEVTNLAIKSIISNKDFDWLRKRLAVVTFEECWSYGSEVSYERDEHIITEHFVTLARAVKNKDAAGLGSLAYALSRGDHSVLQGTKADGAVRVIAEAIKRPIDFWEWTKTQDLDETRQALVKRAHEGFKKAGWPWDRAFAQAAAYLAITGNVPTIQFSPANSDTEFPFWVCIDKHTSDGKNALREAAKRLGLNVNKVMWLAFYFESAKCHEMEISLWWEREVTWRMAKLDLSVAQAKQTWENIRPIVITLLQPHSAALQERLLRIGPSSIVSRWKQQLIF